MDLKMYTQLLNLCVCVCVCVCVCGKNTQSLGRKNFDQKDAMLACILNRSKIYTAAYKHNLYRNTYSAKAFILKGYSTRITNI